MPTSARPPSRPTTGGSDDRTGAPGTLFAVTVTERPESALETQLGLADRVVDEGALANAVERFP